MSAMGARISQFEVPVCNSFQARILNDQLCYEVDLSRFSNKNNIIQRLDAGFAFVMDYNEDRQIIFNNYSNGNIIEKGLTNWISESHYDHHAFIYLDTIGNKFMYNP